jgi:hypothetical protein
MGTYVYAVRRKNIPVLLPDGKEVKVWLLRYLYKPSYSREAVNRPYHAVIGKLEKAFERAKEIPDYIVHVDEHPHDGDRVSKWPGIISCHDGSGRLPGEPIGYLKREGSKWKVVSKLESSFPLPVPLV